jgi:transposase
MPGGKRNAKDTELVGHLAAGLSPAHAAKRAGVSRATVYRRLADPAFRQRVEEARAELWKRAAAVLSKSAVEGAVVLRRLLRSADEKVKLQAAKIVLEQGVRVRDHVELAQRLAALEDQISHHETGEK